jgi:hypothetical protein
VSKDKWNDSVWSKVIADQINRVIACGIGLIVAGFCTIYAFFPAFGEFLRTSVPVPYWAVLLGAALLLLLLLGIMLVVARRSKPPVKITLINVYHRVAPTKLDFATLKVYCEMQNNSKRAVDVQISTYISKELKVSHITRGALQLKFQPGVPFSPNPSVERVAVFPGQTFSAWIAPDERLFNKESFERLRSQRGTGQMGTLVLNVDGQEYPMPL